MGASPSRPADNYVGSPQWGAVYVLADGCNGHGSVNNASLCVCDEGWSGTSDFVLATGVQCQVFQDAIVALWSLTLLLTALMLWHAFPRVLFLVVRYRRRKAELSKKGKSFTLRGSNMGLLSILVGFSIVYPFLIATGLIKVLSPHSKVGIDPIVTCTWIMTRFGLALASGLHQPHLVAEMLRAQNVPRGVIRRNIVSTRAIFAVMIILTLVTVLPVVATAGQNITLARACFSAFCLCMTCCYLCLVLITRTLALTVHRVLTSTATGHSQNDNILAVRDKLSRMQRKQYVNCSVQMLSFTAFGLAPPLWILHDYLLPVSWIGLVFLGKEMIDSIALEKPAVMHSDVRAMHSEGALQHTQGPGAASSKDSRDSAHAVTTLHSQYESDVVMVDVHSPELIDSSPTWNKHRTPLATVVSESSETRTVGGSTTAGSMADAAGSMTDDATMTF